MTEYRLQSTRKSLEYFSCRPRLQKDDSSVLDIVDALQTLTMFDTFRSLIPDSLKRAAKWSAAGSRDLS